MIHLHSTQAIALRVLIVDEDAIEREIIRRCVEMLGWPADAASGLDDAMTRFDGRPHDILVIDLNLDRRDCAGLLGHKGRDHADPAVIFVSGAGGRDRTEVLQHARERGARVAGVLTRPVDPYRLHALLLSNPAPARRIQRGSAPDPGPRDLEQALSANEIHAEYQPKTDLATGETVGLKALARWRSPVFGAVPPGQFVPIAEQSALIGRLTFRVLEDAIAACRKWREARPDCGVAVNISPYVLADPAFLPTVEALLDRNMMPPDTLIAEVTESALLSHMPVAIEALTRLSLQGVRVSMSGFGTGWSSVRSLMRMPFTELKIDRSFVGVCRTDPDAWRLVCATIALARELGMHAVAEGIETEDISDRLRDIGCDMGQGWYFGRPMQEDALLRWLRPGPAYGTLANAMLMANLLTADAAPAPAHVPSHVHWAHQS